MKNLIYLLLFSCGSLLGQEKYCEIIAYKPTRPNSKYEIAIDSGQVNGWSKVNGHGFKKDGKEIEFNTPIDVLNYMSKEWEFVQAYSTNTNSLGVDFMNIHYVLRRKKNVNK